MSFCLMIYVWTIDFPLLTLEYYWTTIFRLSVSTFMSHIIFGMPTWYLSVFFLYLCVNVFIWCHCCFICLKLWKKWIYFVFLNICRGLPIFFADVAKKMFSRPLSMPMFSSMYTGVPNILMWSTASFFLVKTSSGVFSPKIPCRVLFWMYTAVSIASSCKDRKI